jgi:hypothetical protein
MSLNCPTGRSVKVSLIIPAYNEAKHLANSVSRIKEALKSLGRPFEIIISEDGSTDGTDKIARELSRRDPLLKHLHSDERLGKGEALRRAFRVATGDVLIFTDVDLSTDLRHLKDIVEFIEKGADIAIGSRLLRGSKVARTPLREMMSKVYNLLVRAMFNSPFHDHNCGFKAFNRRVMTILDQIQDRHWFWDTEFLIRANRKGYKVVESPVNWVQSKDSKVHPLKGTVHMLMAASKLFWSLRKEKQYALRHKT